MVRGRLFGVGVGPGDPELMTVKAVRVINECGAIAIPTETIEKCTAYQIAKQTANVSCKKIIPVPVPMTKDRIVLKKAYEKGIKDIEEALEKGDDVAFLNLGDPTVYSTYMGIHSRIKADGYYAEIVNGVTSFCAVAGRLGINLAKNKESIHIYPAAYDNDDMLTVKGTRVLMKSASRLGEVKHKLLEMEKNGLINAGAVTDCTMETETVYDSIEKIDENAGYFTTIIVRDKE